jgi:predicted molibdopterin-dependent oxidoreductase YjgC
VPGRARSAPRLLPPGRARHGGPHRHRTRPAQPQGRPGTSRLLRRPVDLSTTPRAAEWIEEYGARPDRFGPEAARVEGEPRIDNDLYVRDYGKCILCYKCVDACGNCVEVCPTGALSARSEYDMRAAGTWDETRQKGTTTVCAYCGVGCSLTLHVQDNEIVEVTSPHDDPVTHGNLCIKGRFGYRHVQNRDRPDGTD